MLRDAAGILAAVAGLWSVRSVTDYDLLGERGPGDYIMLLVAPLLLGGWLTLYGRKRPKWSYGIFAVTLYCFCRMVYMGASGYAAGSEDRTLFIIGVVSMNWAVLAPFALAGGGAVWAYKKIRELKLTSEG